MQQHWEYLVVYIEGSDIAKDDALTDIYLDADKYTDKLNNYGSAGWELVSFEWQERGARIALKRPKQS